MRTPREVLDDHLRRAKAGDIVRDGPTRAQTWYYRVGSD
jgi:hypothetical protein